MYVKEVELFRGIGSHVIEEIAAFSREEIFPVGKVLFRKGGLAEALYILEEGRIELTVSMTESASFFLSQPGQLFGWSALVEPNQYTATAECASECRVIKIDGDRTMRVFEKHPSEGLKVMRRLGGVISARLVNSYQEISGSKKQWTYLT